MAKHNCAICGAEIGLISEQKLADGNYICRKNCRAKGFKEFDFVSANLDQVKAHLAQVERGTKIWNEVFEPRMKTKDKAEKLKCFGSTTGNDIYVSESTGLMALRSVKYKFMMFGKSVSACVYRIADLIAYEPETEQVKNSEGKTETKYFAHLYFRETAGLSDFRLELRNNADFGSLSKYFDNLFGIQKTLSNSMNNAKKQIDAFKAAASLVSSAVKGKATEEQLGTASDALDTAVYGDRTELIKRADETLVSIK